MVELDILRKSLQDAILAKDDITPQEFDKIAAYIEKEEIDKADEAIQGIFEAGNFDIRLVSYYLYAHFLKAGISSFVQALPILTGLINDHWGVLRPLHRKEKQIESSFNWYFTHVVNKLKYNERLFKEKKQFFWPSSILQLTEAQFEEVEESLEVFSRFFNDKWTDSPAKERVTHIIKKISDLKPLVLEEKEGEELEIEKVELQPEVAQEVQIETAPPMLQKESSPFESENMMNLVKKLTVFEKLIEKDEILKAALVFNDITQVIASFDPCVYFPKLFAPYFNLLARHASLITEQSESQETLQWKTLEKLYKADLDQFIEW